MWDHGSQVQISWRARMTKGFLPAIHHTINPLILTYRITSTSLQLHQIHLHHHDYQGFHLLRQGHLRVRLWYVTPRQPLEHHPLTRGILQPSKQPALAARSPLFSAPAPRPPPRTPSAGRDARAAPAPPASAPATAPLPRTPSRAPRARAVPDQLVRVRPSLCC